MVLNPFERILKKYWFNTIMSMTTGIFFPENVIKLLLVGKVQRISRKHTLLENKYNQYSV